jgi:hypothetical protein
MCPAHSVNPAAAHTDSPCVQHTRSIRLLLTQIPLVSSTLGQSGCCSHRFPLCPAHLVNPAAAHTDSPCVLPDARQLTEHAVTVHRDALRLAMRTATVSCLKLFSHIPARSRVLILPRQWLGILQADSLALISMTAVYGLINTSLVM